jgi:hypothetical protein
MAAITVTAALDARDRRVAVFTTGRAESALAWSFDTARDAGGCLIGPPNPGHRYPADGTYNVAVTAPNGDTGTVAVTIGAHQADQVSPATGSGAGGTVVTITGVGLTGATGVLFGATPGLAFAVLSDTSIRVTSPSEAPGKVDVIVQHPAGNMLAGGGFTFT